MHPFLSSILALAGVVSARPCLADPAFLLAPDDPSYSSGWHAPAPPTAGLKPFAPAETKDWLQLNKDVMPGSAQGGMSGMGVMSDGDMKGMDQKPVPKAGAAKAGGPMQGMPGMSGMPGMGKAR